VAAGEASWLWRDDAAIEEARRCATPSAAQSPPQSAEMLPVDAALLSFGESLDAMERAAARAELVGNVPLPEGEAS
jgi:hypothetical protein